MMLPEQVHAPAPIQPTKTKRSIFSFLMLIGKVALKVVLVVYGVSFVYGLGIIFTGLGFFGPNYDKLLSQVQATPDRTINSLPCGTSPYSWAVIEKDAAIKAVAFGDITHIYTYHALSLLKGSQSIADAETPNPFPIGAPFIKAVVLRQSIFNSRDAEDSLYPYYYIYVVIPQSKISVPDFDAVSSCLLQNVAKLTEDLNLKDIRQFPFHRPLGGTILMDDTVGKDENGNVPYSCADGTIAAVGERNIVTYPVGSSQPNFYTNYISIDGKIHEEMILSGVASGGSDPASLLPNCNDSRGKTLADFLHTIPNRILFYP